MTDYSDPDVAQALDSSGSTWKQSDYTALREAAQRAIAAEPDTDAAEDRANARMIVNCHRLLRERGNG